MPNNDDVDAATKPRAMIFISYARADRPRVAPLAAALASQGFDVWWDALIEGGAGFATTIEAKLGAADAVIVVWSAASVASDWVRDEAAHARDRKRLVPVSLDGTEPPLGFRQYHTVDLSRWRGQADCPEMTSVVAGIMSLGVGAPVAVAIAVAPRAKGAIGRRNALLLGGGAVALIGGGLSVFNPFGAERLANSVAVLPFANLSANKEQAYFSDGLSEEIRSTLARNPALKVAAPTSANTFRDKAADAKLIGSKLGVAYLLEGSVRRAGDVVRIAAELIDAKTGFSKWSQSFDRQLTDVFAVQSEIAGVVASALAVRVVGIAKAVGGTTVVAAYDAFLKGRAMFNADGGEESDRAALAQFDAAIAADPNYADAHAARSRSLAGIANQYADASVLKSLNKEVLATAQRAVKLAPDLAAAQLSLAQAYFTGLLDIPNARAPFERAGKLGAGDADILGLYAIYVAYTGRPQQAVEAINRAMSLDPFNPRAFRTGGVIEYLAGHYVEAIALSRHALQLDPKLRSANGRIGFSFLMQQQNAEARGAFQAEPAALMRLPGLAIAEQRLGNTAVGINAMAQMKQEFGDGALYQEAQILAQWGNTAAAIIALDRAARIGDSGLLQAAVDPMLDPLRTDAQFRQLLKARRLI